MKSASSAARARWAALIESFAYSPVYECVYVCITLGRIGRVSQGSGFGVRYFWISVCMFVCINVLHVCMCVCMYVCMYMYICTLCYRYVCKFSHTFTLVLHLSQCHSFPAVRTSGLVNASMARETESMRPEISKDRSWK